MRTRSTTVLEPFEGYVVAPEHASGVIAPPYDALTPRERTRRGAQPDSFLAVLPPGDGDTGTDRLVESRRRLDALIAGGRFTRLPGPVLGVLSLTTGAHELTGLVADLPTSAFDEGGRIRPHEQVRSSRVASLAHYLDVVGVASSPVCVSHLPSVEAARALARVRGGEPVVDHTDPVGRVRLWVVDDPDEQARLVAAVQATEDWLLADGHHRAAAARDAGRVLSVLVADDQLRIRPFHRRVRVEEPERAGPRLRDLGLAVADLAGPAPPQRAGEVTVGGGARWWRVTLPPGEDTPLGRLDVTRAGTHVLAPLLGGGAGPEEVTLADHRVEAVAPTTRLVDLPTERHVGVALVAPTMREVREVVGEGGTLPPKTTYMVPKQRSGLLIVPR
jgi:uncharacterized protein (DUF1015 family)